MFKSDSTGSGGSLRIQLIEREERNQWALVVLVVVVVGLVVLVLLYTHVATSNLWGRWYCTGVIMHSQGAGRCTYLFWWHFRIFLGTGRPLWMDGWVAPLFFYLAKRIWRNVPCMRR